MSGPWMHETRTDQFGHRARRRKPLPGRPAVFVPEACVLDWHQADAADVEAAAWRPHALAAVQALQYHGYRLVLVHGMDAAEARLSAEGTAEVAAPRPALLALPPDRHAEQMSGADRALLMRLSAEAQVQACGILASVTPQALPGVLQRVAERHRLDLKRAWFLCWEEGLGAASRQAGCRSLRLMEPGRPQRRRWPLLRGHVPMKLADAVAFILRCDGHPAADFDDTTGRREARSDAPCAPRAARP